MKMLQSTRVDWVLLVTLVFTVVVLTAGQPKATTCEEPSIQECKYVCAGTAETVAVDDENVPQCVKDDDFKDSEDASIDTCICGKKVGGEGLYKRGDDVEIYRRYYCEKADETNKQYCRECPATTPQKNLFTCERRQTADFDEPGNTTPDKDTEIDPDYRVNYICACADTDTAETPSVPKSTETAEEQKDRRRENSPRSSPGFLRPFNKCEPSFPDVHDSIINE